LYGVDREWIDDFGGTYDLVSARAADLDPFTRAIAQA
jgi:hypothetical protein